MAKNSNAFERLTKALDEISTGYGKFFGLEKSLMKEFFTEEDANMFADMIPRRYQSAAEFAKKNGVDETWASERLYDMSKRSLIVRRHSPSSYEVYEYAQYPIIFGIIEFQLARFTAQGKEGSPPWKLKLMAHSAGSGFLKELGASMPLYRTVPFHKEMVVDNKILPYDDIEEVLNRHTRFSVAPCVCRAVFLKGACNHPTETCVVTDDLADFYNENGIGREITREECYQIIMEGEKDGRIIQVNNSKNAENICSCCTCGCGMIKAVGRLDPKRDIGNWWNNYVVSVEDPQECTACGRCVDACGYKVLKVEEGKVSIKQDRAFFCMGCGICAAHCSQGVLRLRRKSDENLYEPPETIIDAHEKWHQIRSGEITYEHAKA